jgi:hypothetical protein
MLGGRECVWCKRPCTAGAGRARAHPHLERHIASMSTSRSDVVPVPKGMGIESATQDQRCAVVAWAISLAVFEIF